MRFGKCSTIVPPRRFGKCYLFGFSGFWVVLSIFDTGSNLQIAFVQNREKVVADVTRYVDIGLCCYAAKAIWHLNSSKSKLDVDNIFIVGPHLVGIRKCKHSCSNVRSFTTPCRFGDVKQYVMFILFFGVGDADLNSSACIAKAVVFVQIVLVPWLSCVLQFCQPTIRMTSRRVQRICRKFLGPFRRRHDVFAIGFCNFHIFLPACRTKHQHLKW